MKIQGKPKVFQYTSQIRWSSEKRGILTAEGKPDLEVSSPPEFGGHPGIWTPEELLVSAANACTMATFLSFAARKQVALTSYECEATGTLEMVEGKFRFTKIVLRPRILVARWRNREEVLATFREAEAACLVANSLRAPVEGEPDISVLC